VILSIMALDIKCRYAKSRDLLIIMVNVIMLSVIVLNVIVLAVIMLNVMVPNFRFCFES
jgi:hypothetical protein